MKCPLTFGALTYYREKYTVEATDCLQEGCAWWEAKIGKCSVLRMWIALQDIHEALHDIATNLTVRGKR